MRARPRARARGRCPAASRGSRSSASIPLYVSYVTACGTFLSFQWDQLLVESLFLALWLPADRPAPWVHLAFRVLLVKLYFESGVAKWQSPLHDWQDGSAMSFYYETAPIPTALARWAHRLPAAWHHFESWFTLAFELAVPWLAFGPRRARLVAFFVLTFFQWVNTLTANYGFFTYLAAALGVFLLVDADIPRRFRPQARPSGSQVPGLVLVAVTAGIGLWTGLAQFAGAPMPAAVERALHRVPIANVYHLFGHITRKRIEPDFQVLHEGRWESQVFRWKPGPIDGAPPVRGTAPAARGLPPVVLRARLPPGHAALRRDVAVAAVPRSRCRRLPVRRRARAGARRRADGVLALPLHVEVGGARRRGRDVVVARAGGRDELAPLHEGAVTRSGLRR